MARYYSNPKRESDTYALPDIEVFEMTAAEVAEMDEDLIRDAMKRPEFRLAAMNSRVREKMLDTLVEENGITGGWCWWSCFPGCMPDSDPIGPFKTHAEALADAREGADEYDEEVS